MSLDDPSKICIAGKKLKKKKRNVFAKKLTKPYEREHESTQRDSNMRSSAAPTIVYSKLKKKKRITVTC